ncbi:MAG: hypothetical protein U1F68_14750 [Gammaproteobacteria bacterium]
MMNSGDDDRWLQAVKTELDASVDALDAATLTRLRQARRRALAGAVRGPWRAPWLALASCATVAAMVLVLLSKPQRGDDEDVMFEDIDILVSTDDVELYDSLDFYEWLDQQEKRG